MTMDTGVVASAHTASCFIQGEAVVLNTSTGVYHGLNRVGEVMWKLLDRPRLVRDLVDAVLEEFAVDQTQASSDVLELLEDLRRAGLVDVSESSG